MPVALWSFVATTALLLSAEAKDKPAREEMAKLAGTWQMTACEQNGSKAPSDWVARRRLVVAADGRFTAVTDDVAETNAGLVVLHLGGKPLGLDFKTDTGPFAGRTVFCVFERSGDDLKVCFAAFGTDRPTDFNAGNGSGHVLTVYRRAGAK